MTQDQPNRPDLIFVLDARQLRVVRVEQGGPRLLLTAPYTRRTRDVIPATVQGVLQTARPPRAILSASETTPSDVHEAVQDAITVDADMRDTGVVWLPDLRALMRALDAPPPRARPPGWSASRLRSP